MFDPCRGAGVWDWPPSWSTGACISTGTQSGFSCRDSLPPCAPAVWLFASGATDVPSDEAVEVLDEEPSYWEVVSGRAKFEPWP